MSVATILSVEEYVGVVREENEARVLELGVWDSAEESLGRAEEVTEFDG